MSHQKSFTRKYISKSRTALTIALLSAASNALAASYTAAGITISSPDAGFSQQSANTFYFPTSSSGVTTFSFSDGRGFTINNTEQVGFGSSSSSNIAGIPNSGNLINVIAGYGFASSITILDALNGSSLVSGQFRALTGSNWFAPSLSFSYLNGTLTINAVGDVQQINADGSITYSSQDVPFLIGNFLLFAAGPTSFDTQTSLHMAGQKLRSVFNTSAISSNFANMNTYDCNLFDAKGMCASFGGRFTTVDNPDSNSTSAVLVLGYKATPHIRIGGFLDQSVNDSLPSGISLHNKIPLMGAFVVWNQNEDGLGYQIKIANAYQSKDVKLTRDVIGTSEAGKGSTDLTTESYVGELSYAFNYKLSTLVRPYLALRYTKIKQDGYTETGVSTPLSFSALEDRSTSALLGLKINHQLTPKANLTASLGIEQDLEHQVDRLSATGVNGLTSENFNNSIKHTRPVASIGAYYALTKNQRLSADVFYQQLPFQGTGSKTAYVNYTVGF
ncbi:MAG: autotransporter outer membrane beta-barrel domain-containing protein [Methylotenera sp.]|uniref:autotransporter outer membrane beta-barrel domain-containing protein n=1 Tax=Methylotenera sp. TaxID=2051956 RepID=UPI00248A827E|nr:autotransporter outer membrane beta-barrel domain-containing protein [Methylotenera sp.]MDI1309479.1 autotransporter outer membrane beta-barrel domain-containing protein [Methylotenera sp.]